MAEGLEREPTWEEAGLSQHTEELQVVASGGRGNPALPCTKACAGSEPPQPTAARDVRAHTQASDVLATKHQKSNPSGAFPESTSYNSPEIAPNSAQGWLPAASASGERREPATLQRLLRIL